MKTVAIEDLMIGTVLTFCENLAELGCPKDKEPDMWFRELSVRNQRKVAEKMIEIEERYSCDKTTESNQTQNNKGEIK